MAFLGQERHQSDILHCVFGAAATTRTVDCRELLREVNSTNPPAFSTFELRRTAWPDPELGIPVVENALLLSASKLIDSVR